VLTGQMFTTTNRCDMGRGMRSLVAKYLKASRGLSASDRDVVYVICCATF
jgi:hypothetical protein